MFSFDPKLIDRLRSARRIVLLTGSGTSSESGIPTFRDVLTGLWERFDPQQLATAQAFREDPELVWGWYEWRRGLVLRCQPNAAHDAIASMQKHVPDLVVVTQNVDDLHERAGTKNVIHLHGSLHQPRCYDCSEPHTFASDIPAEPEGGRRLAPPVCPHCGGLIRPGVVWFGESLPQNSWLLAQQMAEESDIFFSVGTSSLVYPAASLPHIAKSGGACLVQVNPHATGIENVLDHDLQGNAGQLMPVLVRATWGASVI